MRYVQVPKDPAASGLTEEELQTVGIFVRNTPSVVNIANIGEVQHTEVLHLVSFSAFHGGNT